MFFGWEKDHQLSTYVTGGGDCGSSEIVVEEVPSLGCHMVYSHWSDPSYELERTISHSNLTIHKHGNEEKILRKFTNEYFKQLLRKM